MSASGLVYISEDLSSWHRIKVDNLGGTACKMPLFLEKQNNYSFVRHSEAISVALGLEF